MIEINDRDIDSVPDGAAKLVAIIEREISKQEWATYQHVALAYGYVLAGLAMDCTKCDIEEAKKLSHSTVDLCFVGIAQVLPINMQLDHVKYDS